MRHTIGFSLFLGLFLVCVVDTGAAFGQQAQRRQGAPAGRAGFTFQQFSARHDLNGDGKVDREEFKGAPQFFRLLDQNEDGVVTAQEFSDRARGGSRRPGNGGRRAPDGVNVLRDLEYAVVDGESLRLDLYLPEKSEEKPPLLVWIHGGGWTKGSKSQINPTFIRLTAEGYAAASIDYRLDGLITHPNQIHDCKAAIRWLRVNADKYGYDVTRIGVGGGSAGGHLALLLGMSNGVTELEGDVGGNSGVTSKVDAIVDLFGPSALELFADESERFRHKKTPELLTTASPITYLTEDDPPVLIFHGDKDPVVPVSQSEHLHERYQKLGLESSLHVIEGAGHGGAEFSDPTRYELVREFFARHIRQAPAEGK